VSNISHFEKRLSLLEAEWFGYKAFGVQHTIPHVEHGYILEGELENDPDKDTPEGQGIRCRLNWLREDVARFKLLL